MTRIECEVCANSDTFCSINMSVFCKSFYCNEILIKYSGRSLRSEGPFMTKIQGPRVAVYNASRAEGAFGLSLAAAECNHKDFFCERHLGIKYKSELFFQVDC